MMNRRSTSSSRFYKQVGAFIAICSIWDFGTSSSEFLPQTFETCGIFLADFQPISNEQGDVIHEIIEQLQFGQKIWRSLIIIKNEEAQRDIHPDTFRSMKYNCFLHVHINFGKDLVSTIPWFENPFQSALYQKALFLLVVNSNPYDTISVMSWYSHVERQYRIFVIRVKVNLDYNQLAIREKPFVLHKRYFFCTFCERGFILLNDTYTNFLSVNLWTFEKTGNQALVNIITCHLRISQ